MRPRDWRLPSPATCLALLALFVSLGGTTYAVTSLPRNSVGTEQLRARAVTEHKLSNSAVITRKLAGGAVTARKIARGTITGSRIAPNGLGGDQIDESLLAAVPRADNAEQAKTAIRAAVADRVDRVEHAQTAGAADTAALAQRAAVADRAGHADQADVAATADALATVDINAIDATLQEGDIATFEVDCDLVPGQVGINGGFVQTGDDGDLPLVVESAPVFGGWRVVVADLIADGGGEPMPGQAYAICVKAQDVP
jgi:hypothetical protein